MWFKFRLLKGLYYRTGSTFIYDRISFSDNRSMNEKTLKKAQEEDLQWFRNLSEAEKISVIIGLIRTSNGAMILKMQERLKPLLKKKLMSPNVEPEQSPQQKLRGKLDEKLHSLVKGGNNEEILYDPKDPLTMEVDQHLGKVILCYIVSIFKGGNIEKKME